MVNEVKQEVIEIVDEETPVSAKSIQYYCSNCKTNIEPGDLVDHHKNYHSGSRQQLKCLTCKQIYHDQDEFNNHVQTHSGLAGMSV